MKKILITLILCLFSVSAFGETLYVGSMKSNKYHYTTCKFSKRIKDENLIYFKTPELAIKAGYKPCRICRPPTKGEQGV